MPLDAGRIFAGGGLREQTRERGEMANIFRLGDYGASPEKELNTAEIQAAIDDCHISGGGRVICGEGVYITGTLEIKSNVELYLSRGCVLKGSEHISDYDDFTAPGFKTAPERTTKHLIRAVCAENAAICGPGELNGSGLSFYSSEEIASRKMKKPKERPRIAMLYRCNNISIEEATFVDAACWTIWLMKCENVCVRGIKIFGDDRLFNNDGIDIDSCKDVTVSGCIIKTEDDCIVLRSITKAYEEPAACENVAVSNCVLESCCQCIRVGCPGDSLITNCVFSNMTISGRTGIHFEMPKVYLKETNKGSAEIHNIVFSNFTVNTRRHPVRVFVQEGISIKRLSGLSFSDFRVKSGQPFVIQGSSETMINPYPPNRRAESRCKKHFSRL